LAGGGAPEPGLVGSREEVEASGGGEGGRKGRGERDGFNSLFIKALVNGGTEVADGGKYCDLAPSLVRCLN